MAAIDLNVLLQNTESIVATIVAILGLLGTFMLFLGKLKLAKKFNKAAEEVEGHKKEIVEATDTLKVLITGVDAVKDAFRSKLKGKELNAGAIIEAHADTKGMKDLLNKSVEEYSIKKLKEGDAPKS